MKRKKVLALLASLPLFMFSCEAVKDTFGIPNRSPVISSFDFSPKSKVTSKDVVTFTVVANDPEGKPLQQSWTATKGTLSSNSGTTVSWRPTDLENKLEAGLSTISVVVSDGIMTNTASVNIMINNAVVEVIPTPVASPTPSASVSPSASPSAVVSTSPSPTPSISPIISASPSASPSPIVSASPTASPTPAPSIAMTVN